jgi:hypothetical protein
MTAADQDDQNVKMHLANRGRPHMTASRLEVKVKHFAPDP